MESPSRTTARAIARTAQINAVRVSNKRTAAHARARKAHYAEQRKTEAAAIARSLGRNPDPAEMVLIETAAAQLVEARKLRAQGKSSLEADRLVIRCFRSLGLYGDRAHDAPGRTPTPHVPLRDRLIAEGNK